nr:hypothetical protein [Tanacetum cinerariifolium]GEY43089.1 hypothetical protein [Tanacetum cinerariifolium]
MEDPYELYIKNRETERIILNSVENGPLIWPTIKGNGETRKKKYEELSDLEKLQADCDLKATNIILQGLPLDVYAIVNHHKVSKEIHDRVKLLMQGTSLSLQDRECKLVTVQQVQGRQVQSYDGTRNKGNTISLGANSAGGLPTIIHNAASQTNHLDTYDSDCDDISSAKAVLMAKLSNYDSNILSEEKHSESLTAELEKYKERVKTFEQRLNIDLSS